MKKWGILLAAILILGLCTAGYAEELPPKLSVAPYTYALPEGESLYFENLIFPEDVIISGDNAQIIFSNCWFAGNIILTSECGTRVMLFGCRVNGVCEATNNVKEATIDYNNPKFLTDAPVDFICRDCAGTVVALGDFEIFFNGERYTMADAQLFSDPTSENAGFVPYEGQEASYFIIGQWIENGEEVRLFLAELDPAM